MPSIFISYRRIPSAMLAQHIAYKLKVEHGIDAYVDTRETDGSSPFPDRLLRAIDNADIFVCLLAHSGLETDTLVSEWVNNEIAYAQQQKKPMIPIFQESFSAPKSSVTDPVRALLSYDAVHFLDLRNVLIDESIASLARMIQKTRRETPAVPPAPTTDTSTPRPPRPTLDQLIDMLYAALDSSDFERAQAALDEIVQRGGSPGLPLDDLRDEIARARSDHERKEAARKFASDRQAAYVALTRLAARLRPEQVWKALNDFWRTYPNYDPDNLARFKPTPAQLAMEAARTFAGKRNRDWTPFISVFSGLKIPEMPFCLVPTGEFQMGSKDGKWNDEEPQHLQKITAPYWIAQYPVTNAQWALAVKAGAVKEPEGDSSLKWYKDKAMADAPVVGVTWFMVRDFAAWCGARLPGEREWEYAARGVESLRYSWGNDWNENIPVWSKTSGGKPAVVTTKPEGMSWIGAHHLIGNVWEWTGSLYEGYPYPTDGSREQDTGDRTDVRRVLRGGSWGVRLTVTGFLRAACRFNYTPGNGDNRGGFRLALS